MYDILKETETTLFDTTEQTLSAKAAFIDRTLDSKVWEGLDKSVSDYLSSVTVAELVEDAFVNNTDI